MIEQVIFRHAAEEEFKEAYAWYEARQRGLGSEFVRSIDACVQIIRRQPEIYPIVHKNVRQGVARRFPYSILYIEAPARIVIISVFHSSRDPRIWKRRA
jgi:plasmid stabilization system protein ParE